MASGIEDEMAEVNEVATLAQSAVASDGKLDPDDAALIMTADGRMKCVVPGVGGDGEDGMPPHCALIAGLYLSFRDQTEAGKQFMDAALTYLQEAFPRDAK